MKTELMDPRENVREITALAISAIDELLARMEAEPRGYNNHE